MSIAVAAGPRRKRLAVRGGARHEDHGVRRVPAADAVPPGSAPRRAAGRQNARTRSAARPGARVRAVSSLPSAACGFQAPAPSCRSRTASVARRAASRSPRAPVHAARPAAQARVQRTSGGSSLLDPLTVRSVPFFRRAIGHIGDAHQCAQPQGQSSFQMDLEAPSGLEPVIEVLQTRLKRLSC